MEIIPMTSLDHHVTIPVNNHVAHFEIIECDCSSQHFQLCNYTYFLVKSTIFELQCSASGMLLQKLNLTIFFKHFFGYLTLKLLEIMSVTFCCDRKEVAFFRDNNPFWHTVWYITETTQYQTLKI